MTEIRFDLEMCKACKKCIDVCFVDVIRWNEDEKIPVCAYPEDCVWCLGCEIACPTQCIEVVPTIPGRMPRSYEFAECGKYS